jgi:hypothetical protein
MKRVKDDGAGAVDAATYLVQVEGEFEPALSAKHDAFVWMTPKDAIAAAKTGSAEPDPDAAFLAELEAPWPA